MVSLQNLRETLEKDNVVKIAGIDADGIPRGKTVSKEKFLSVAESGLGFCSVTFGWDMHDRPYDEELKVSNSANGYRDITALVDLTSFRRIPWENNVPFFLLNFIDPTTRSPVAPCPRLLLRGVVNKYKESLCTKPMCGAELEYYQYKESNQTFLEKNGLDLTPLTTGMFGYSIQRTSLMKDYFYAILDNAKRFDIDIEGLHTETGPGVYEAAIAYDTAERMADKVSLYKYMSKCIAPQFGILPCFMAKPAEGMPGNSGHVHVSLVDMKTGANLFARDTKDASPPFQDAAYLSDLGRHFLAGVLDGLPDIMPLLAPNINSYKRLNKKFWAPVTVSWGLENRLASIRLISPPTSSSGSTRLEIRTPGADLHPHYALAGILALGLRGIQLKLPLLTPPLDHTTSSFEASTPLPSDLETSTKAFMATDSLARQVLGDEFVDHYGGTRLEELKRWSECVTDWEVKRYMEVA